MNPQFQDQAETVLEDYATKAILPSLKRLDGVDTDPLMDNLTAKALEALTAIHQEGLEKELARGLNEGLTIGEKIIGAPANELKEAIVKTKRALARLERKDK